MFAFAPPMPAHAGKRQFMSKTFSYEKARAKARKEKMTRPRPAPKANSLAPLDRA
jgi:hypothetical protein